MRGLFYNFATLITWDGIVMNKFLSAFILWLTVVTCSGCQFLYENGQNYQKSKCISEAQTSKQWSNCETTNDKSYRQYQSERNAIIK